MRSRLLILLLATLLQTHQLTRDIRFHPDEAYFMTFARHASVNGDWMLAGSLDKPPLSIYLSAVSMILVGNTSDANSVLHLNPYLGEFAGRLPNFFFAILLVVLMMRLAHDLYHDEKVTLLSGLLTATSPYMLAFGATAFTDMSLLFWLVLALWLTVCGKWGWAGIALGLAFWSKQQTIFYLPFIIVLGLYNYRPKEDEKFPLHKVLGRGLGGGVISLRFFLRLILLPLLLFMWDTARPETSIFLLGTVNNAPDNLFADPSTYMPRLYEWLTLSKWLIGYGELTFIAMLLAVVGWLWHSLKHDLFYVWDTLFLLFIGGYIGLHTVLAFNQYDRYLLLILPPLILLCARGIRVIFEWDWVTKSDRVSQVPTNSLIRKYKHGLMVGVIAVIFISTIATLHVGIPIGGDKGDYQGIDDLADYLNDKPIATIIYDRWLGWELAYYMGQWTNKRRVYFPTPQALADGATELEEIGDRYLVAPHDQTLTTWLSALESRGFTSDIDYQTKGFIVYRLSVPVSDA
jgi:4-amino-4-deoxy-L-arabinose transferase-like glycosyltransferase